MNDIAVSARGLVKRFGDFTAVDGIDLDIRRGEIFGFLGPNGAGKTTTIRMLTTLSPPTEGTVEIDGRAVSGLDDPVKEGIGIVQQHISLDRDVTVLENIRYHAILHRIPRREADARISRLVGMMGLEKGAVRKMPQRCIKCAKCVSICTMGLEPYLDRLVIDLSGGWKRRVAIACCLVHEPSLIFLDEPTAGLDTQSRHMLWELVHGLNSGGRTVFLTTHYMDEAEELCDRVAIIDRGRIVRVGTPKELCESIGAWAVEYREEGRRRTRYFGSSEESRRFQDSLPPDSPIVSRATNLEDVFLELTGRDVQATEEVRYRV